MIRDSDAVVVVFSKEQVRQCKIAHFLKTFGEDALPDGPELAAMMGKFQFVVDGWNHDPQEIYVAASANIAGHREFWGWFSKIQGDYSATCHPV